MNSISFLAQHGHLISVTAAGTGPTIMLLHGFPLDHRMWLSQLATLSKTHHVIAPDFRGFGGSSLSESSYSLSDLADDVELVRQHLAPERPISLIGLSMGGYVAFEYWQRHGQHLSSLVLVSTKPTADSEAARESRYAMAAQAEKLGTWPAVAGMLEKLLSPELLAQGDEIVRATQQMMRDGRPEAIAAAQQAMAIRQDFTRHLPEIAIPTLILTGQHDKIAPPDETARWSAKIPNSHFDCLTGVAHLSPLETPVEFNQRVLSFLPSSQG